MFDKFIDTNINSIETIAILPMLANFVLCLAASFLLKLLYVSRSFSLTGKQHIGSIIPMLSGSIFLVIVIVKSSLALSLGLVGALSIVRFRTPIKEPEELIYLFIAIAIGLGYGAGQTTTTTVLIAFLMIVIYFRLSNTNITKNREYNLVIDWSNEISAEGIISVIHAYVISYEIVKYSVEISSKSLVLRISAENFHHIEKFTNELRLRDKSLTINFFETNTLW
jgi:hypothetical protein